MACDFRLVGNTFGGLESLPGLGKGLTENMKLPGSMSGRGAVAKRAAVAPCATAAFSRSAGFTLIELMTVVAVIGILATLILSGMAGAKKRSRQTVCAGNLRQVALAVELYQDEATALTADGKIFRVEAANGYTHEAKSIIAALGMTPRKLGVPGEEALVGKGV